MSDLSFSDWVFIVLVFGLMAAYCYLFGHYLVQTIERLDFRRRRPSYRKWGVETVFIGLLPFCGLSD